MTARRNVEIGKTGKMGGEPFARLSSLQTTVHLSAGHSNRSVGYLRPLLNVNRAAIFSRPALRGAHAAQGAAANNSLLPTLP